MSECCNPKCNKIFSSSELRSLQYVVCPDCHVTRYCSEKCKNQDREDHKADCAKSHTSLMMSSPLIAKSKKLDEYEPVKNDDGEDIVLGKGTFGDIRLVKDSKTDTLFSLKTVNKSSLRTEKEIEYLKKEIKLLKQINHPNILKLVNSFEDKDNVFIVMEYASNHSVSNYIKKKERLSEINAFVLFIQACLAVDHLHKIGFIHRDINSENLWIDSKGNLKLSDLGWCGKLGETRVTYCGAFDYMAPEVLKQEEQTEKTDVWCLGILLYEMVVGQIPFQSNQIKAKLDLIQDKALSIPKKVVVSDDLKSLILMILKENPMKRPSMAGILSHPWVVNNAKKHNIDISKYLHLSTNENHTATHSKEHVENILNSELNEETNPKSDRSPIKGNSNIFNKLIKEGKSSKAILTEEGGDGSRQSFKEHFKEAIKKINDNKSSIGSKNMLKTTEEIEDISKRDKEATSILTKGKLHTHNTTTEEEERNTGSLKTNTKLQSSIIKKNISEFSSSQKKNPLEEEESDLDKKKKEKNNVVMMMSEKQSEHLNEKQNEVFRASQEKNRASAQQNRVSAENQNTRVENIKSSMAKSNEVGNTSIKNIHFNSSFNSATSSPFKQSPNYTVSNSMNSQIGSNPQNMNHNLNNGQPDQFSFVNPIKQSQNAKNQYSNPTVNQENLGQSVINSNFYQNNQAYNNINNMNGVSPNFLPNNNYNSNNQNNNFPNQNTHVFPNNHPTTINNGSTNQKNIFSPPNTTFNKTNENISMAGNFPNTEVPIIQRNSSHLSGSNLINTQANQASHERLSDKSEKTKKMVNLLLVQNSSSKISSETSIKAGGSYKKNKNMAVIEEIDEKDTLQTKNSNTSKTNIEKPKKSKKTKKKKEKLIEEKKLLKKKSTVDIRSSLNDLKQKKEMGITNDQRDSGWCSKKLIKKPDEELSFFERMAVMFGCIKQSK